jgi:phosphatidate cytidylyltransferase
MDTDNLIKRHSNNSSSTTHQNDKFIHRKETQSSDSEMEPLPSLPNGSDLFLQSHHQQINKNNSRSKLGNLLKRSILGIIMISGCSYVCYSGPLIIMLMVLFIQTKCFHEVMTICNHVFKVRSVPFYSFFNWYFYIVANYYLNCGVLFEKMNVLLIKQNELMEFIIKFHFFISFSFYTFGIVVFVLSLEKRFYLKQFILFSYTQMSLVLLVIQPHLMIRNTLQGVIWFVTPVVIVNVNDISAYFFGILFGKTKLIKLSPKKTWEGYLGGAVSTVLINFVISSFLISYKRMICPLDYHSNGDYQTFTFDSCQVDKVFDDTIVYNVLSLITIKISTFQIHSAIFALFGSIIGPFGGFFASGFKRAFKIKDFAQTIPGHGGFMDRFDCQFFMSTFVYVYLNSFTNIYKNNNQLNNIFNDINNLSNDKKVLLYNLINKTV